MATMVAGARVIMAQVTYPGDRGRATLVWFGPPPDVPAPPCAATPRDGLLRTAAARGHPENVEQDP
jgi:hypothetical protein